MGQPRALHRKIPYAGTDGKVVVMTVLEAVAREVRETGLSPTTCATRIGVPHTTALRWTQDALRLVANPPDTPTKEQHVLARYWTACAQAKADYLADKKRLLDTIAAGGLLLGDVTEETIMVTDAEGIPRAVPGSTKRRTKTSRTLPDARVLMWELERADRSEFATRLEVTGAEGGPVVVDTTRDRALALIADLDELDGFSSGVEAGRALEAERAAEAEHAEPGP